jgi:hypothetical protein
MLAKMDSFQEEMRTNQVKTEANNEKIEVHRRTIVSRMGGHQARIGPNCEEWVQYLVCQSTDDGDLPRKD